MIRCVVIGIGPVGSILCAHLLKAGADVTLVDILESRLSSIREKGLKVSDSTNQITGEFVTFPQKFFSSVREVEENPDFIFICTKTYGLEELVRDISDSFPSSKVIVFQNGLDNEEYVSEFFGKENVFRCINNYAGIMTSDSEVEVTFFNRPNYIGAMDKKNIQLAEKLAESLTQAGIETKYTDDIKKPEWDKALLNACLAPVSAVTGLTMKDVMDSDPLREMVGNLLEEGINVAKEVGIGFPDNFFEFCMSYLKKGGYHKPSMLVDLESGRDTEVDFLNGKIVEYGMRLSVPIHYNRLITALVKGMEQKRKSERK